MNSQEQENQAEAVNKSRSWQEDKHLPNGTVYLLTMYEEKNSVGVKDLPVAIIGLVHYSQPSQIGYKLSCKDWFSISETYSRGELRPQEHVSAKSNCHRDGKEYCQGIIDTTTSPL